MHTRWGKALLAIALFGALLPYVASAHEDEPKTYEYESIDFGIYVNVDSTFDAVEEQTFDFKGHFHKGWRSIPESGISSVSNVRVFEGEQEYTRSAKQLEKGDPSSFGKYYYERGDGRLNIEWYFDARDEKRTFTISYRVHSGISFLDDKDELYWNLATEYEVPIRRIDASVILPSEVDTDLLVGTIYYTRPTEAYSEAVAEALDGKTMRFALAPVMPQEDVTIAVGWPIGIIDRAAYLGDFAKTHIAGLIASGVVMLSLLTALIFWYFSEVRGKGRGTIVPEYEPPQSLSPAMAEALVKEGMTKRGWPATIIDLAVRGYIDITEEKAGIAAHLGRYVMFLFPLLGVAVWGYFVRWINEGVSFFFLLVIAVVLVRTLAYGLLTHLSPKEYILTKKKEYAGDETLRPFERSSLVSLFLGSDTFSTKKMKRDVAARKHLFESLKELKHKMYEELEAETHAYATGLTDEKKRARIASFVIWGALIAYYVYSKAGDSLIPTGPVMPYLVMVGSVAALVFFIRFEARLTHEGAVLRERWLGFKLYLKTAEKDRLQNLSPELFERYLPYAMVFGVEKQWASAFDVLYLAPPSWYHGNAAAFVASSYGGGQGSFAPSAFAASFSTSFGSSFGSAGGGASGGGGSAGGGGGGGGGGAS